MRAIRRKGPLIMCAVERKAKFKKAIKRNRAEDVHKKDEMPNSSNT